MSADDAVGFHSKQAGAWEAGIPIPRFLFASTFSRACYAVEPSRGNLGLMLDAEPERLPAGLLQKRGVRFLDWMDQLK